MSHRKFQKQTIHKRSTARPLRSVTNPAAIPRRPAGRASSLVPSIRAAPAPAQQSLSHPGDQTACPRTACAQAPRILLHNGPKATHIPFITARCYNCPALLLVTVVNPLRDLLYTLHFITGVQAQKKLSMCTERSVLSTMPGSHWGSWTWPPCPRRGCYIYKSHPQQRPKPQYHWGVTLNKRRTRPHTENYVLRREMKGLRRKRASPDSWIRRLRWLRSPSLPINLQIQCKLQAFLSKNDTLASKFVGQYNGLR